jgi:hypothetical protein
MKKDITLTVLLILALFGLAITAINADREMRELRGINEMLRNENEFYVQAIRMMKPTPTPAGEVWCGKPIE